MMIPLAIREEAKSRIIRCVNGWFKSCFTTGLCSLARVCKSSALCSLIPGGLKVTPSPESRFRTSKQREKQHLKSFEYNFIYTMFMGYIVLCSTEANRLGINVPCMSDVTAEDQQTESITIRQILGRLITQQHVCRRNPHMKTPHWLQVFISIMCWWHICFDKSSWAIELGETAVD